MEKEFNWDILFTLLQKRLIIPIIGSDLILIRSANARPIPLYDYLTRKLSERLRLSADNMTLRDFILKHQNNTLVNSILKPIYNEIQAEDIYFEPLDKLTKITDFDIFLSTTFDNFIERQLVKNRCNGTDAVDVTNFSSTISTVKPSEQHDYKAMVFNLLGSIHSRTGYAKTDAEILEYFYSLNNDSHQTSKLRDYTDGKSFLFIGCSIPDWINRLFIRAITNEPFAKSERVKFIVENSKTNDSEYYNFLWHFKAEIYQAPVLQISNSVDFVNELYSRWLDYSQKAIEIQYEGMVFLSFNHKDREQVIPIRDALISRGVDVWYDDSKLGAGAVYDKQIERQIKACKLFVAFISQNSIASTQRYVYKKEWRLAESRRVFFEDEDNETSFIKPFIIDDTSLNDERIPETFRKLTIKRIDDIRIVDDIIGELQPQSA